MPRPDCPDCGARTDSYVCPECEPEKSARIESDRQRYYATETRKEMLRVPPALQEIPFIKTPL